VRDSLALRARRLARRVAWRLRALVRRDALDREVREEFQLHVDLEAEDLARTRGMTPAEARRRARVAFGGMDRFEEEHRDARGMRWVDDLASDARYAVRALRRTPGFTLSSIVILALGIGATTAVFGGVNAVLIARLPYAHDEQLVRIYEQDAPTRRWSLSIADLLAVESDHHTFSAVGGVRRRVAPVAAAGDPQSRPIAAATSGFFRALGTRAAAGRLMDASDDRVGAPPVVVLSDAFATQAYGSAAAALGRSVLIDGHGFTVIGVLPVGVQQLAAVRADVWPALQPAQPSRRGPFGILAVGRLADGVSADAAQRNLAALSARIFPIWQAGFQDSAAKLTPVSLRRSIIGDGASTMGILAGGVGLVLLIAIANVASLMLVRATGRRRELSLRTVLGATRARLVRLLVTESLVLTMVGAAAGVVVGVAGLSLLRAVGPYVPRLAEARLDGRAMAFAVAVAMVSGIVVGAYPVLSLFHAGQAGAAGGGRTVGGGRRVHAVRSAFVAAQFALALPLLAGAGLLMTTFLRLQHVDPGFEPDHLVTLDVALPSAGYANDAAIASYWRRASARISAIPGVGGAAISTAMPPNDEGNNENNFDLVDRPVDAGTAQPTSPWPSVTNDYFATMGVRLIEGRLFEPTDTGAAPVVVVSRAWADHYYPGQDAVGRQLISGGCTSCPHTTVVGVVTDVKYSGLRGSGDAVYSPATEGWFRTMHVFVRTSATSDGQLRTIRDELQAVDRSASLSTPAVMTETVYEDVAQPRHLMTLLGLFAAAALGLAAVGIFGMLSHTVAARRQEIGVRMALGARAGMVVGMIIRRGMAYAAMGAGVGLVVAAAGARLLAGQLYGVTAADPATLAEVTALLLAVALAACWLPARRAAQVDPARAIRTE